MSFYGKITEPDPEAPLKTFAYIGRNGSEVPVEAHDVFFYGSGHIGFWNNTSDGARTLVLAVKTDSVRELTPGGKP